MPILNIGSHFSFLQELDLESGFEPSRILSEWIFSVMCWPGDVKRQEAYQYWRAQESFAAVDSIPVQHGDDQFLWLNELSRVYRNATRGFVIQAGLPSYEALRRESGDRIVRGIWAGATLCIAYLLHKDYAERGPFEISLTRIWGFLFRSKQDFFSHPPRKESLKEAWGEFKDVAHLWAGLFFFNHWMAVEALQCVELDGTSGAATQKRIVHAMGSRDLAVTTKAILVLAREFQEFGLGFTPKRSGNPLLDPNGIWRVEELQDWGISFPSIQLSDIHVDVYLDN